MKIFTPHAYQEDMIDFVQQTPRCALWAQMGSGKTVSTLTALDQLSAVEDVFPALILAPLRVAKSTWPGEVNKWAHLKHLKIRAVTGSVQERLAALRSPADIYTMNYDNLAWLTETLGDDWPFKTVVADEFTRLKSFRLTQGAKRAKALGKVAHTKVTRFIGLTGTPASNGLADLWGQIWFLDKGERLGRSFSAFESRWFAKGYDGYSIKPHQHSQKEIEDKLKDVCLTVTGLPVDEPIYNTLYVDLPPEARKLYRQMEKDMFAIIEGEGVEAPNAAAKTNKCLQLANGAAYFGEDSREWKEVHDEKIKALDSIIEEANGTPVLVAYHFKSDLTRLLKAFPKARHLDANPKTIDDWNAGKIPVLLSHPACLHPSTEVLTEHRGWVRIVDVAPTERVFDGLEFVNHSGCFFSGIKVVTELFGVTMTPNHKLLINGIWVEAKNVRNIESARRKAVYTYAGDDPYLSQMLKLQCAAGYRRTKRAASQPAKTTTLRAMHRKHVSSDDGYAFLADMGGHEKSSHKPKRPKLSTLWRRGARYMQRLAYIRKFLSGYVFDLRRQSYYREGRQFKGVQQTKLSMGLAHRTAIQQNEQSGSLVSKPQHAFSGILPHGWRKPVCDNFADEPRDDCGGSASGLPEVTVPAIPGVSEVYDLVNCGPRNRFLIRNATGEVFISHNSAGHGLNLAEGGNILAFFSVNWNLEEHMQIIERIGPMRQAQAGLERPVYVHFILAKGTVDDMVLERLQTKKTVQEILLEALKRRVR